MPAVLNSLTQINFELVLRRWCDESGWRLDAYYEDVPGGILYFDMPSARRKLVIVARTSEEMACIVVPSQLSLPKPEDFSHSVTTQLMVRNHVFAEGKWAFSPDDNVPSSWSATCCAHVELATLSPADFKKKVSDLLNECEAFDLILDDMRRKNKG